MIFQAEVAQVACKSACEHIAKSVMAFMLSDDVKQLTMGALQQINLDTIQCERKCHNNYYTQCSKININIVLNL